MKLLEEFWYGNIEPTEYDTSSKEYKKLQELICRNEEKLRAAMTDDQKELFEKYTDCVREYQTITDCLIFQNSFKLGARMMLEIMERKPQCGTHRPLQTAKPDRRHSSLASFLRTLLPCLAFMPRIRT